MQLFIICRPRSSSEWDALWGAESLTMPQTGKLAKETHSNVKIQHD
jgi:hypothetical protein